jgi:hypothetical protein
VVSALLLQDVYPSVLFLLVSNIAAKNFRRKWVRAKDTDSKRK